MSRIPRLARTARARLTIAAGLAAASILAMTTANAQTVPAAAPAPGSGQLAPAAGQQPRHACGVPSAGRAVCLTIIDGGSGAPRLSRRAAGTGPGGLTAPAAPQPLAPADLQAAYKLPSATRGQGGTIAIVDAFDDPAAESDLAAYRAEFGLPACTTTSGCFRRVAQDGSANYPQPDSSAGWEVEESLDLDMASAICPNCHLILVEASDDTTGNLGLAVDEAARLGATVISNSYGAAEDPTEPSDAGHYDHPGVVITASTGDFGFGVYYPAAFSSVVAVGGTTLYPDAASARGWTEQAWAGAGSGCSAYIAKPAWQHDVDCAARTVGDIAAVADPDTPVYIYDTFQTGGTWFAVGGTSVAAPVIAAAYALAGNTATITPGSYLAAHQGSVFDVSGGANGFCGGGYLCAGLPGYDGPTGWGTPDGTGAL